MNPQQKIARRKVLYLGVILGLFTVSMLWRGVIPIPLSGSGKDGAVNRFADRVASRTVLSRAAGLELREVEQGEADLEGTAFNLALVGSRGLVVAYLWSSAIEKQKRNDFHALEDAVQRVTKLQPHFITPWIFQSWNIAYNVSVEMQGSGDMYYYIARGIDLLAEGERRQGRTDPETGRRLGSPDMRHQIGFYYQNKFGVSDNKEVLRCLFQLSCVPPDDRNPDDYLTADGEVDREKFRRFCEAYPHLVRRLRGEDRRAVAADAAGQRRIDEALKCERAEDVVAFLRANQDVPGRFKYKRELAAADKQFPALPPRFAEGQGEAHPEMEAGDDFTAYKAARAWFQYSMVPVPDNPLDQNGKPLPARTPQAGEYDAVKYRVPRQPMLILFRQYPARAQSYQGEMEQYEGWFDGAGWRVDDPAAGRANWWFPPADPGAAKPLDVVVGTGRAWSLDEWRKAAEMWAVHGERFGLEVEPGRMEAYRQLAGNYAGGGLPPDPAPGQLDDPAFKARYQAACAVFFYRQNRQVTNFPFFLASATAEARPATVQARKTLFEAEQARKLGNKAEAVRLYRDGLEQWKRVLLGDPAFHGYAGEPDLRTDKTQEETFAYELSYLRLLVQDDEGVRKRADELAREAAARARLMPFPFPAAAAAGGLGARDSVEEFRWHVAEREVSPMSQPMGVKDGVPANDARYDKPWVRADVKDAVRQQQNVLRKSAPMEQPRGATDEK
jgi:hypothetical protein